MPQSEIEIRFREALELAEKLGKAAMTAGMLSREEIPLLISDMERMWKGPCAALFLAKEEKLCEEPDREAGRIQNMAEEIKSCAERFYRSERRNSELAVRRTYK